MEAATMGAETRESSGGTTSRGAAIRELIDTRLADIVGSSAFSSAEKHVLSEALVAAGALQNGHAGDVSTQGHTIGLVTLLLCDHLCDSRTRNAAPGQRVGKIAAVAAALAPYRWPLAAVAVAAFFSPHAVAVIEAVSAAIRGAAK